MEFSLSSIQIKFLFATEFPTHRHSRRLKDIVETLTGDAATLNRLRVDSFEYLRVPVETGFYWSMIHYECVGWIGVESKWLQWTDLIWLDWLGGTAA